MFDVRSVKMKDFKVRFAQCMLLFVVHKENMSKIHYRPGRNSRHSPEGIFLNENHGIMTQISLNVNFGVQLTTTQHWFSQYVVVEPRTTQFNYVFNLYASPDRNEIM